jgi:HEAT repeat protein
LHAALWLGRDGWPTLRELAVDGAIEDDLSARAIAALGEQMPIDEASRALEKSLDARRFLTARAAVNALGRGGDVQVAPIARVMAREPEVASAAALALGLTGSASAEAPLLAILRGGAPEVRAAVAEALGHVGTATSVVTLKELAQASRGRLRSAALDSILRIQSRLTDADPGQLSLSAGPDGQLALTEDEQGRVSPPDPQDAS